MGSFECQQCGNCCKGVGFVYVTTEDITAMSKQLGITTIDFIDTYTYSVGRRRALTSHDNEDCIFLKDNLCIVHDSKPSQCRKFPYWPEIIRHKACFEEAQDYCEGLKRMDHATLQRDVNYSSKGHPGFEKGSEA